MMTMMNMDYETYKAWETFCNNAWERLSAYLKENQETILDALTSAAGSSYIPSYARGEKI